MGQRDEIMRRASIESQPSTSDFEPSMKTLKSMMKALLKDNLQGKTNLSPDTNLNYDGFAKYVVWLEKTGLVKSMVQDSKLNVVLTPNGKILASTL